MHTDPFIEGNAECREDFISGQADSSTVHQAAVLSPISILYYKKEEEEEEEEEEEVEEENKRKEKIIRLRSEHFHLVGGGDPSVPLTLPRVGSKSCGPST